VQLYHDIVAKINKSLVKIAQAGGLPSSFVYKGNPYHVTLKFPVLVVMGDTEEHDKLGAHKACCNSTAVALCRHCDCPFAETSTPYYEGNLSQHADVEILIARQDTDGLAALLPASQC
jgi:hypothetical protein